MVLCDIYFNETSVALRRASSMLFGFEKNSDDDDDDDERTTSDQRKPDEGHTPRGHATSPDI